jgi:ankyrin repeat protein
VKLRKFTIGAALALTLAAPAYAQLATDAGDDFVAAVKKSDGNKVNDLLNTHPPGLVNAKDFDGNTGLAIALARRDEDWTAFLLNHGADPNLAGNKAGDTPLIVAARAGTDTAVEWLLSKGAKVDATNRAGETPLIVAVQHRALPVVRLLLAAGANPDRTDNVQGYSARGYAQRDPRARDILSLIEARGKAPPPKTEKLDDFKL